MYFTRMSLSCFISNVTRDLIAKYHFDPHGYYYNVSECQSVSCLYTAAKGNYVDIVEYLIKECGCDPMMEAAKYDSVPFLHYVASEGLQVYGQDSQEHQWSYNG